MAKLHPPSDDPTTPPHPEGGWSHGLTWVQDALIAHENDGYLVHPSGVFDGQGAWLPQAAHWRGRPLMTPPARPEATAHLPGRWLWAGVRMEHFGHFIMESLGRLWALDRETVDGILFIPESGFGQPAELAAWQRQFLGLLGIDLPVRLVTEPTRVQALLVPGQGFGIGPLIGGTAPFRAFVQSRFAKDIPPQGPEKLYLSRTRLPADLGGIVHEDFLERALEDRGYGIFHPQEHPLEVQIARYKAARQVVGLDGSALHLFALVARPDQQVAVIQRRPGSAPEGIVNHLARFTGRPPLVADALHRTWMRSDRKKADNFSYGELNFRLLGRILAREGFLPEGGLPGLPEAMVVTFIAWAEASLAKGRKLRFVPMAADGKTPAPLDAPPAPEAAIPAPIPAPIPARRLARQKGKAAP